MNSHITISDISEIKIEFRAEHRLKMCVCMYVVVWFIDLQKYYKIYTNSITWYEFNNYYRYCLILLFLFSVIQSLVRRCAVVDVILVNGEYWIVKIILRRSAILLVHFVISLIWSAHIVDVNGILKKLTPQIGIGMLIHAKWNLKGLIKAWTH